MARTRAQIAALDNSLAALQARHQPADDRMPAEAQYRVFEFTPNNSSLAQKPHQREQKHQNTRSTWASPQDPGTAQRASQKLSRKRPLDDEAHPKHPPRDLQRKRQRGAPAPGASGEVPTGEYSDDPILFWAAESRWPSSGPPGHPDEDDMENLLAGKRSSPCLSRKRSDSGLSSTPSDQRPREEKSAPYRDPRYELLLQTKGTFMDESDLDITDASKNLYQKLLDGEQAVPSKSLFSDNVFKRACRNLQGRNEAKVIQDISRLIVPSAQTLALLGAEHLRCLIESVNEGWNNAVPLTGTRPQPDYSVGFSREAFTQSQLDRISPILGDWISGDQSFFMATYYMLFPFLTNEVKCGIQALDIADRQNAHSMTLAVRAVVELLRLVGRESEVHREILAFSISHDHRSVRIYGCYPVIDGRDAKYYRHLIRTFDFTELDGREKWTAYRFTRNIYDLWMPGHLQRIRSAIDQLPPAVDFDVPSSTEATGISHVLEIHRLSPSGGQPASIPDGVQSAPPDRQVATPESSFTKPEASKRQKSKRQAKK